MSASRLLAYIARNKRFIDEAVQASLICRRVGCLYKSFSKNHPKVMNQTQNSKKNFLIMGEPTLQSYVCAVASHKSHDISPS
jgi:hypothetical protein